MDVVGVGSAMDGLQVVKETLLGGSLEATQHAREALLVHGGFGGSRSLSHGSIGNEVSHIIGCVVGFIEYCTST